MFDEYDSNQDIPVSDNPVDAIMQRYIADCKKDPQFGMLAKLGITRLRDMSNEELDRCCVSVGPIMRARVMIFSALVCYSVVSSKFYTLEEYDKEGNTLKPEKLIGLLIPFFGYLFGGSRGIFPMSMVETIDKEFEKLCPSGVIDRFKNVTNFDEFAQCYNKLIYDGFRLESSAKQLLDLFNNTVSFLTCAQSEKAKDLVMKELKDSEAKDMLALTYSFVTAVGEKLPAIFRLSQSIHSARPSSEYSEEMEDCKAFSNVVLLLITASLVVCRMGSTKPDTTLPMNEEQEGLFL